MSDRHLLMRTVVLLAISLFPAVASAATYYVATSGSDSNPGTLASPYCTLQRGVDQAIAGDTIIVRNGTYTPPAGSDNGTMVVNINKAGNASAPITLKAESKWGAVLDCQYNCHSFINFQANSAWWVIQDFEIRNGSWGGIWSNSRGGKNIKIKGNHIHHIGVHFESVVLGICGIYTDDAALNFTIDGNVIDNVGRTNDILNSYDHGIYSHGNLIIINNVFYNSLAGWHIQTAVGFSGVIANNTFYGPNMYTAARDGQIMLWDAAGGAITIRNNIFYNSLNSAISAYDFSANGGCSVDNNIVYGAGVTLGSVSGCSAGSNRLNTDPLFVNAAGHDFHLLSGSPAKDTGIIVPQVSTDFDGNSRPQGTGYDIGGFEYVGVSCDVNGDGPINVVDVQQMANQAVGSVACTADINRDGQCNVIDVQLVVNAALGGACVSP